MTTDAFDESNSKPLEKLPLYFSWNTIKGGVNRQYVECQSSFHFDAEYHFSYRPAVDQLESVAKALERNATSLALGSSLVLFAGHFWPRMNSNSSTFTILYVAFNRNCCRRFPSSLLFSVGWLVGWTTWDAIDGLWCDARITQISSKYSCKHINEHAR